MEIGVWMGEQDPCAGIPRQGRASSGDRADTRMGPVSGESHPRRDSPALNPEDPLPAPASL